MPLQTPSPLTKRQTNLMLSLSKHEATKIQPNNRDSSPVKQPLRAKSKDKTKTQIKAPPSPDSGRGAGDEGNKPSTKNPTHNKTNSS